MVVKKLRPYWHLLTQFTSCFDESFESSKNNPIKLSPSLFIIIFEYSFGVLYFQLYIIILLPNLLSLLCYLFCIFFICIYTYYLYLYLFLLSLIFLLLLSSCLAILLNLLHQTLLKRSQHFSLFQIFE